MTCSLQAYRVRIGTFLNGSYLSKSKPQRLVSSDKTDSYVGKTFLILTLLYLCCSLYTLSLSTPDLHSNLTYRIKVYTPPQSFQLIPDILTTPAGSLRIIRVSLDWDSGADI